MRRRATPVTPRRATRDAAPAAPREAVGARAPPAPAKPPKIGECNEHLRRRAKARDAAGLRREWRALRRHHEPNDRSWGILLDGLARVGVADACLATLRAVPGGGNVVHHTIVVDDAGTMGDDSPTENRGGNASAREMRQIVRNKLTSLYSYDDELGRVFKKTYRHVDNTRFRLNTGQTFMDNVALKEDFMRALSSYSPFWLQLGVDVVVGGGGCRGADILGPGPRRGRRAPCGAQC